MTAGTRSLAIDVMRGMTLALMIVVNMSVDASYAPLQHAKWNGLTPTDVVFPSFLFVAGASMSFALEGYRRLGAAVALSKIFRRTALIFLCGYLLYWFPFFHHDEAGRIALIPIGGTRIPGVLQRIALDYCLVSLAVLYIGTRGALILAAAALLGHWAILAHFGDYTLQGNAALRVDLFLLGPAHLYHGEGIAFDPEGVLGTLPAAVNMLAGYVAGRSLRQHGAEPALLLHYLFVGVACIALALAWNEVLPINKKLWTSSYVLCTIGIDLCVLAVLVYAIDLHRWRGASTHFFEVFGKNTLFIYLLSEIANASMFLIPIGGQSAFEWIYHRAFESWAGSSNGALLYALAFMLLCWLVARGMDRRRIYISL
jgi:predicted acyltransferase